MALQPLAPTHRLLRGYAFDLTLATQLEIDYADYREGGGVKIPYRWTLARPGGSRVQLSEVKENALVTMQSLPNGHRLQKSIRSQNNA